MHDSTNINAFPLDYGVHKILPNSYEKAQIEEEALRSLYSHIVCSTWNLTPSNELMGPLRSKCYGNRVRPTNFTKGVPSIPRRVRKSHYGGIESPTRARRASLEAHSKLLPEEVRQLVYEDLIIQHLMKLRSFFSSIDITGAFCHSRDYATGISDSRAVSEIALPKAVWDMIPPHYTKLLQDVPIASNHKEYMQYTNFKSFFDSWTAELNTARLHFEVPESTHLFVLEAFAIGILSLCQVENDISSSSKDPPGCDSCHHTSNSSPAPSTNMYCGGNIAQFTTAPVDLNNTHTHRNIINCGVKRSISEGNIYGNRFSLKISKEEYTRPRFMTHTHTHNLYNRTKSLPATPVGIDCREAVVVHEHTHKINHTQCITHTQGNENTKPEKTLHTDSTQGNTKTQEHIQNENTQQHTHTHRSNKLNIKIYKINKRS
eukprot:GHVR01011480.1.p1 GENE.GHVR01011480.1~~GHVR01011480.1.p1  ORF type:complete len:431 (-),score=53.26 GHVR01011480.1:865-2157(-)